MPSTKKKNNLRRQVRKDVRAAYRPIFKGLGKQKDIAQEQRDRDQARLAEIYGRFNEQFSPLMNQFGQASQGILQGAQGALGSITGSGMEAGVANALGTMGQGYVGQLATGQQGALSNMGAGLTAANLGRVDKEANVLQRYRDFVNDLSLTRSDLKAQKAQTFLDQLQQRRELRLAQKEQKLRAEQFDKEFSFKKDQTDRSNRKEDQAREFILNQAEKQELAKLLSGIRKESGWDELTSQIDSTKSRIEALEANKGQWSTEMTNQYNQLKNSLSDLQTQRKRIRNKLRKRRKSYKRKHGD